MPEKVIRNGVTIGLPDEAVLVSRDGREVPIDASQTPIIDAQGAIVGAVTVFHEVSERRRIEQARARAEQNLKEIVQSIGEAFFSLDREWRFTRQ